MRYEPIGVKRDGAVIRLTNRHFSLEGETLYPSLTEERERTLALKPGAEESREIAGMSGVVSRELHKDDRLELTRELFTTEAGDSVGIRMKLKNVSSSPFRVGFVTPLAVRGDDGLTVAGGGVSDWRALRLSNAKSDIPGVYRPSREDVDLEDAAFGSLKLTAGMGVQGDLDESSLERVVSEPLTFIKNEKRPQEPGLCICAIGQEKHLTSIYLETSDDRTSLKELGVRCEFDGVVVEPGEERNTHWIMVFNGDKESEVLRKLARLQQDELDISHPRDRLNLYCSWYFYGREFLPEDLDENLRLLRERPMPLDAFIIDNGWIDAFGDWNANEKWPDGMEDAARKIRDAGFMPGIWTCPFTLMKHSKMAREHPELILKDADGEPVIFKYVEGDCFVVDPTSPYAREYFTEMFTRLKNWGYTYHKLDFLRAVMLDENARFRDPRMTRSQAYRHGLSTIREAVGDDAYILACGGILDAGNYGIADSVRVGADSIGAWEHYSGRRRGGTLVQIKQAMVRNYASRLIHTDPDSLMLRRRTEPFRQHAAAKHNRLSDGKFTDEEAFSLIVRQYITGGNANVSERLAELPEDRRALLRHIIPAFGPPADIIDMEHENCPTMGLSEIVPRCDTLPSWHTLSVSNWDDEETETRKLRLSDLGIAHENARYAVFEFHDQRFLGLLEACDTIELEIPSHGTRLLRIAPWEGRPCIAGTDLHLSGGGCELRNVSVGDDRVDGEIENRWDYPVTVHALFPDDEGAVLRSVTVGPDEASFSVKKDGS